MCSELVKIKTKYWLKVNAELALKNNAFQNNYENVINFQNVLWAQC